MVTMDHYLFECPGIVQALIELVMGEVEEAEEYKDLHHLTAGQIMLI